MATSTQTDKPTVAAAIEVYLRSGTRDSLMAAWAGELRERAERSPRDLRTALVDETMRRAAGRTHPPLPPPDVLELTRRRLVPMVWGLFPSAERIPVLQLVERSVIFVSAENIARLLIDQPWDQTAWALANLYLASLDVPLLSPDAPSLVGLSEETMCYVSPKYFSEPNAASDFVVHEVAHIFHNCKRRSAGLPETRRREWLLHVAFRKRETFAYACEFYATILRRSEDAANRRHLAAELGRSMALSDGRVDAQEVADIVGEAASSRAGRLEGDPSTVRRACLRAPSLSVT